MPGGKEDTARFIEQVFIARSAASLKLLATRRADVALVPGGVKAKYSAEAVVQHLIK